MQDQRRKREIVNPIHSPGNLDLFEIVTVDLYQDFNLQFIHLCGEIADEGKCLGDHETTGSRLLDRVPDGIEPYDANTRRLKLPEDFLQIARALCVLDVNIDLLSCERGPEQAVFAVGELKSGER